MREGPTKEKLCARVRPREGRVGGEPLEAEIGIQRMSMRPLLVGN